LLKKVKKLNRQIHRIASKKGPNYKTRIKPIYRELLQKTRLLTQPARRLCQRVGEPAPTVTDTFGPNTLQAFIVRTERVADTARRRVIEGESVPNRDKLLYCTSQNCLVVQTFPAAGTLPQGSGIGS